MGLAPLQNVTLGWRVYRSFQSADEVAKATLRLAFVLGEAFLHSRFRATVFLVDADGTLTSLWRALD